MKIIISISLLIVLSACGGRSKPDRKDQPVPPSEASTSGPITPSETAIDPNTEIGAATPAKMPKIEEVPYAEENTELVGDVAQQVLTQKEGAALKAAVKNADADKVMGWLKNGNTRFVKRKVRADGQSAADRARLVSGQKPHAIIFTCSDSRVPPEIIFDQKLGEIYVVRNDELSINDDVLRSLEKGAALGAQLLVVLTYEGCSSDSIKTSGVITSQSAKLAERESSGRLKIQPAVYDLKTGVVKFE